MAYSGHRVLEPLNLFLTEREDFHKMSKSKVRTLGKTKVAVFLGGLPKIRNLEIIWKRPTLNAQ